MKAFIYPLLFVSEPASFDRWWWLRKVLKKGVRSLDAGSGSGTFTLYAALQGSGATGISFDEVKNARGRKRAAALGIRNVEFVTADLRTLGGMKDKLGVFDEIFCFETIEHIRDDRALVRDFAALLSSGGRLLITAPYKHYRRFPGDSVSETEDGGHVRWGYTHEEMRSLLEGASFEIVEEQYLSGVVTQLLGRLMRFLDARCSHLGWLVTLPLRVFQLFDRRVTALMKYPWYTICVAAEKR